jgi:beta-galactosidase
VDFAKINQIEGYPLVYLPFPLMIEEDTAERLRKYVESGGCIISEACPAQFGNAGYVQVPTPGYGLDKVFGVRAESGPETVGENAPYIDWNGKSARCAMHRQRLVVTGAEVIAEYSDGGPAIVENAFGTGKTILIGTYPGLSFEWGSLDAGAVLPGLAAKLGVTPMAVATEQDIWVRLHRNGDDLIAFIVNISFETKDVTVRIFPKDAVFNSSVDMVTGEPVKLTENLFTVTVDGHDAKVLRLSK